MVCVSNFTPVLRYDYRLGVPVGGRYEEILNTDAEVYGGSNSGNAGVLDAEQVQMHSRPYSLKLTLPPLATLILRPSAGQT